MAENPQVEQADALQSEPEMLTLHAPAKVNLHLGVHDELDERRYHRVDSLMCAVELHDVVRVSPAEHLQVKMDVDCGVAPEKNSCWQAARAMERRFGRAANVRIAVEKHTPAQSGLGGSSSDAAAVILALCKLWDIDAADPAVAAAAREVGADVPFFLDLRPTLLVGAGDVVEETFPEMTGLPVVLVRPREGVSTPAAYREFDREPQEARDPEDMCQALRTGDRQGVAAFLYNNLAPAALALVPECRHVLRWLSVRPGVLACQVTGSGSCVFGICRTAEDARRIADEASNAEDWWSCATETVGTGAQFC